MRWRQALAPKVELLATARAFEEKRGNGTPYQRNASREKFASLALAGAPADTFAWDAVAYVQDQTFASTFSGVNATRTAETPASDQFAVPSTAFGAAWTGAGLAAAGLFGTGAAMSLFSGRSPWLGGLRMLGIGALAGGTVFLIGHLIGVDVA